MTPTVRCENEVGQNEAVRGHQLRCSQENAKLATKSSTIDMLPSEILEKVLSYLPPTERLNSSLTCRRWAQSVSASLLLRDVRVTIEGSDMEVARAVFMTSDREYANVQLSGVDLSECGQKFWTSFGRNIRELELVGCRWRSEAFLGFLRSCPQLEYLNIRSSIFQNPGLSERDLVIPDGSNLEEVRASLKNVRRLHLSMFVTEQFLTQLLEIIPEVTAISFSDLDCSNNLVRRLSEIRGTDRKVRGLDLKKMLGHEGQLELLKVSVADLEELRLSSRRLPSGAYDVVSECQELRRLSLEANFRFEERHLEKILSNNPELEALELVLHRPLAEYSVALIHHLKRLRSLSLDFPRDLFSENFLCNLGNMSELRHLELSGPIASLKVWRSVARLPKLHSLHVTSLTSESFEVMFESFKNLRALDLGDASNLTDADMKRLSNLKRLRSLKFTRGVGLTDLTFEQGVGSAAMEALRVSCASLTDAGLASIAAHHGGLKTIALDGCNDVTSLGILSFLRGEPRLRELELRAGSLSVLGDIFDELAERCPRLEVIRFFPKSGFDFSTLSRFDALRPKLAVILS